MEPNKLTSEDLDAIREFRTHPGWKLMIGRLIQARDQNIGELGRFGTSHDKANYNRGFIEAVRMTLKLPEDIEREAKEAVKDGA